MEEGSAEATKDELLERLRLLTKQALEENDRLLELLDEKLNYIRSLEEALNIDAKH